METGVSLANTAADAIASPSDVLRVATMIGRVYDKKGIAGVQSTDGTVREVVGWEERVHGGRDRALKLKRGMRVGKVAQAV